MSAAFGNSHRGIAPSLDHAARMATLHAEDTQPPESLTHLEPTSGLSCAVMPQGALPPTDVDQPAPLEPEPVPSVVDAVLELQMRWGHVVLEVQHHAQSPAVTLGPGGDIHVDVDEWRGQTRPLFTCHNHQYVLHLPPGFTGVLLGEDGEHALEDMVDPRLAHRTQILLDPADSGELHFHDLCIAFRFNAPRTPVLTEWFDNLDVQWLNTLLMTLLLGGVVLSVLMLYPQNSRSLEEERFPPSIRIARYLPPTHGSPPALLQRIRDRAKIASLTPKQGGGAGVPKPAAGDGAKTVPSRGPSTRAGNESIVQDRINKMFGDCPGCARVFGGEDPTALLSDTTGITGRNVTAVIGLGGLVDRGTDPGGARETGFIGASVNTRRRHLGNRAWDAANGLGVGRPERAIEVEPGLPVVGNALDKNMVRDVVRTHLRQVKYCYEHELARDPTMAGRVMVQFVVDASGHVVQASVVESSLGNRAVEQCILNKVHSWVFSKPRGGGTMVVNYPFMLKHGG